MAGLICRKWTIEEESIARQLLQRGADDAEFRSILGRTRNAAFCRITRINLKEMCNPIRGESALVPAEVMADAARRSSAPVTITGFVMGDPPIGFSALDRRNNQAMQAR